MGIEETWAKIFHQKEEIVKKGEREKICNKS